MKLRYALSTIWCESLEQRLFDVSCTPPVSCDAEAQVGASGLWAHDVTLRRKKRRRNIKESDPDFAEWLESYDYDNRDDPRHPSIILAMISSQQWIDRLV